MLEGGVGYYWVVKERKVELVEGKWEIKVKDKGKDEVERYYVEGRNHNGKVIAY